MNVFTAWHRGLPRRLMRTFTLHDQVLMSS